MEWKTGLIVCAVLFSLGVVSLGAVLVFSPQQTHEIKHGGTPIDQTRFASLVESEPCPVMYPGGPLIVTDYSVRMSLDYRLLTPILTLEESEAIALQFFSKFSYLSDLNLTPDPVWNTLVDNEYYTLRFNDETNEAVYAAVNAISGTIVSFGPTKYILSPLAKNPQDSQMLNQDEVEEITYGFLHDNNYTFSSSSRYDGPLLVDDRVFVGFWVYRLDFFCVINGSRVEGNGVTLEVDIETGEVLDFYYHWSDISSIPVENIISAGRAEQNTIRFFGEKGATGIIVNKTQLWFYMINSYPIREYWLCWVVDVSHEQYGKAIVNAIGGEILDYTQIAIL